MSRWRWPLRRRPRLVAWGWRPGDVQLVSDEDWQRAAFGRAFAEVAPTMARVGRSMSEAMTDADPAERPQDAPTKEEP